MGSISGSVSLTGDAGPASFYTPEGLSVWLDATFDNRGEAADAAGWARADLKHRPDADLIAALWRERGPKALSLLVGDFAIAVFDASARTLYLARDPTGQRPLHYRTTGTRCSFASMPRELAQDGPDMLSVSRVADFLLYVPDPAAGSFFNGVLAVEPGGLVTITPDRATVSRWWSPRTDLLQISVDEALEEATKLFRRAIQEQLQTSRPVIASQLSGGLDSGAVTAFAAEALAGSSTRLLAVTGVPSGPAEGESKGRFLDDGRRAAELAGLYPHIEHRFVSAKPRCLFEDLPTWHRLFQRPIGNYCNQLWVEETYAAAAAAGADLMLTGLAGNYTLSFDGRLALPDLFGRGRVLRWLKLALGARRSGLASWRSIFAQTAGPYLPAPLWSIANRFRRTPAVGAIYERAFVRTEHPLIRPACARAAAAGADPEERGDRRMTDFRLRAITESDPGDLNHGAREQWGIETRDPTADRRLIEFCLRLGPEHFFDGRRTRLLARRMLEGRMPDESRLEEANGLQGADWRCSAELSRPAMRREIEHIRADPELSQLFDHQAMARAIDDWPADGWDDMMQIYTYRTKLMRTLTCANWLRTGAC